MATKKPSKNIDHEFFKSIFREKIHRTAGKESMKVFSKNLSIFEIPRKKRPYSS